MGRERKREIGEDRERERERERERGFYVWREREENKMGRSE